MKRSLYFLLFAVFVFLSACSISKEGNSSEKSLEPVTIHFSQQWVYFSEQDFNELIAEPVNKRYPHITAVMGPAKWLGDALVGGETVDIYITWDGSMPGLAELDVFMDITPLAKKNKFDLGRFDQDALAAVKDSGKLHALPYGVNFNALYYNKDIFEKFGVSFPKDGMTWEEAIELAKKITVKDNDVQYRGLEPDEMNRMLFPLSLNILDAKTDKVMVNSDPYKTVFEITKQIFSIQGNEYKPGAPDRFIVDKTLGMLAKDNLFLRLKDTPDLNWDIAQYPSYKERLNTYGMYDLHIMIPVKTSKHQDDIMRVMEVFFSDEVQTAMVKKAREVSTLKDPVYAQKFAADLPELQGKNIASIFKSKPAPAPGYSKYYSGALGILYGQYDIAMRNEKDINTVLRESEELINQYISGQKTK